MVAGQELKLERISRELNALTEVAKTLVSPLDLPRLLDAVLNKISDVLEPAEAGAIMLWDQPSGLFRSRGAFGYDKEILKEIGLRAGESVTGKVFDHGKAILLNNPEEIAAAMSDMRPANREVMARALNTNALPRCTLATPVSVGEQRFGVLILEILEGHQIFTQADMPFIQVIADLIALAIERARLTARADALRETREAERLRSDLLATLSHELRMPLTAIKGYATALLLDEVAWSAKKQGEFLRRIEEECDHMEVMLTEILDSSLIEADQLNIKYQIVCISDVAREIAIDMKRRTDLHNLIVDFPSDFPHVQADPHWIRQVFRNLLDNAIKYSPDGGLIVLRGEARSSDIVISISDQGIGISPEDLIPLFEKYFRPKSPPGINVPSTGLGLPIARSIVEAHGGRIWAESKLGQGTTLSFSLPTNAPMTKD